MLLIVEPFSLVHGAIGVNEDPIAVGLSVHPLALVDVVVRMGHAALAVEQTVFGLALVSGSIWKHDNPDTFPLLLILFPLPLILPLLVHLRCRSSGLTNRLEVIDPGEILAAAF